jgi:MFS family permease
LQLLGLALCLLLTSEKSLQLVGLALCLLLVDYIGRRRCLLLFLAGTCATLIPFLRPNGPTSAEAPNSVYGESDLDITFLFISRLTSYATFIIIFIYTPETYPTRVRSFAFGVFSAVSRLGGLLAPFIGVDLFANVCLFSKVRACSSARFESVVQVAAQRLMYWCDCCICCAYAWMLTVWDP